MMKFAVGYQLPEEGGESFVDMTEVNQVTTRGDTRQILAQFEAFLTKEQK